MNLPLVDDVLAVRPVIYNENWNQIVQQTYRSLEADGVYSYDPSLGDLNVQQYNPSSDTDKFENTAWTVNGRRCTETGLHRRVPEPQDRSSGRLYGVCQRRVCRLQYRFRMRRTRSRTKRSVGRRRGWTGVCNSTTTEHLTINASSAWNSAQMNDPSLLGNAGNVVSLVPTEGIGSTSANSPAFPGQHPRSLRDCPRQLCFLLADWGAAFGPFLRFHHHARRF